MATYLHQLLRRTRPGLPHAVMSRIPSHPFLPTRVHPHPRFHPGFPVQPPPVWFSFHLPRVGVAFEATADDVPTDDDVPAFEADDVPTDDDDVPAFEADDVPVADASVSVSVEAVAEEVDVKVEVDVVFTLWLEQVNMITDPLLREAKIRNYIEGVKVVAGLGSALLLFYFLIRYKQKMEVAGAGALKGVETVCVHAGGVMKTLDAALLPTMACAATAALGYAVKCFRR